MDKTYLLWFPMLGGVVGWLLAAAACLAADRAPWLTPRRPGPAGRSRRRRRESAMTTRAPAPTGGDEAETDVDAVEFATVRIPGSVDHGGTHRITVRLQWVCPACGRPRGAVHPAISFDGSRRLACDGWTNPCGHIDYYEAVRREAASRDHR